jgi:hypothetical protein
MENNPNQQKIFSEDDMADIVEYGSILQEVHNRLVIEGYFLPDGKTWNIFKRGKIVCELILKKGDINY